MVEQFRSNNSNLDSVIDQDTGKGLKVWSRDTNRNLLRNDAFKKFFTLLEKCWCTNYPNSDFKKKSYRKSQKVKNSF